MRELNDVLDKVLGLIEKMGGIDVYTTKNFKKQMMDVPLDLPVITVGIDSVDANLCKHSAFSGLRNGEAEFSVPAEIAVSANIYLPHIADGYVNYEVLTNLINVLFKSDISITRIVSGKMHYNATFMCTILPVTIFINERICEDW